uniref:Ig-like domain-containing protein n=1 Tax=Mastacembelus armatus TaxID=205130 RepID=A0A3Q3L201_9TELE
LTDITQHRWYLVHLLRDSSQSQTNITGKPGDVVTLPCRAPGSTKFLAVNWTRPDLDPKEIFVYRDWSFDSVNQHPAFKERVELKNSQMKDRDVSVTLKDVTFNDTGTYKCYHPSFKERVELKDSQMKDRDVSVTLKDVTFTDTGTYECSVFQGQTKGPQIISIVHLTVSTGECVFV